MHAPGHKAISLIAFVRLILGQNSRSCELAIHNIMNLLHTKIIMMNLHLFPGAGASLHGVQIYKL